MYSKTPAYDIPVPLLNSDVEVCTCVFTLYFVAYSLMQYSLYAACRYVDKIMYSSLIMLFMLTQFVYFVLHCQFIHSGMHSSML